MSKRFAAYSVSALCSLFTTQSFAQATPTPPSENPFQFLAPRRPDGTMYAPTPAPGTTDAGVVTPPTPTPPATPPASTAPTSGNTAPTNATAAATPAAQAPATGSSQPPAGPAATTPVVSTTTATQPVGAAPTAASTTLASSALAPVQLAPSTAVQGRRSMTRARLRILNSTLVGLPARSFSSRILDGVIAIVSGGTSIAAGFLIPSATSVQSLGPIFWTNGGLLVLQGTLSLAWAPAREGLAERYLAMPARTARERRERLRFGEHALDDMAADGTRRRIFSGLGTAATAVVGLGLTYRNQIFNGVAWNLGLPDALIFTTLGVQTIVSLFQLFSASEDERLRDSYWQQVRLLESEEQDSTASTPRVTRSVTTAPSPTAP